MGGVSFHMLFFVPFRLKLHVALGKKSLSCLTSSQVPRLDTCCISLYRMQKIKYMNHLSDTSYETEGPFELGSVIIRFWFDWASQFCRAGGRACDERREALSANCYWSNQVTCKKTLPWLTSVSAEAGARRKNERRIPSQNCASCCAVFLSWLYFRWQRGETLGRIYEPILSGAPPPRPNVPNEWHVGKLPVFPFFFSLIRNALFGFPN